MSEKTEDVALIRICLWDDGTATYFAFDSVLSDYRKEKLDPNEALRLMRLGIPVEVAIDGGEDKISHYESRSSVFLDKV